MVERGAVLLGVRQREAHALPVALLHAVDAAAALGRDRRCVQHHVGHAVAERGHHLGDDQPAGRVDDEHVGRLDPGCLDVGHHRSRLLADGQRREVGRFAGSTREVDRQRGPVEPGEQAVPEATGRTAAVDQDEAPLGHPADSKASLASGRGRDDGDRRQPGRRDRPPRHHEGALRAPRRTPARSTWQLTGPWFRGEEIYAASLDCRDGRNRLLVGATSSHWGPSVYRSDDLGSTWVEPEPDTLRFPERAGAAVARACGSSNRPATRSRRSSTPGWSRPRCSAARTAASRSGWSRSCGTTSTGRSGSRAAVASACTRSSPIPTGGPRMAIAVSAAGFYRTLDGTSWEAANTGIKAPFLPEPTPEFGQCVHKVDRHPSEPDTLFLQHHWGVYRSDDFGGEWREIGADALPSTFGFPVVADPNRPGTAYVLPLTSDEFRCTPDGRLRVFRTTDGGDSWSGLDDGLPQEDAWLTVLRDGFAADGLDPTGLYVGTRTGDVFASADAGGTWTEVAHHLPPVVCVKTAVLG